MTNVATDPTTSNPSLKPFDAELIASLIGEHHPAHPVSLAAEALDRIADDIAMMQIAADADGGITDDFRDRHLCGIQARAHATAQAVRRLAAHADAVPSKPAPEPTTTARKFDFDAEARSFARDALVAVAGARTLLPTKDNADMVLPARMLDTCIRELGYLLAAYDELENAPPPAPTTAPKASDDGQKVRDEISVDYLHSGLVAAAQVEEYLSELQDSDTPEEVVTDAKVELAKVRSALAMALRGVDAPKDGAA